MNLRPSLPRPRALGLAATIAASAASLSACIVIDVRPDTGSPELGLPPYPGAVKTPGKKDDATDISLGLGSGAFHIKLSAVHYVSTDAADDVARFYRTALAKYGPVLDCSDAGARRQGGTAHVDARPDDRAAPVSCGNDGSAVAGSRLFKVGTEGDQRIFSLRPEPQGVSFELMHLQVGGKG